MPTKGNAAAKQGARARVVWIAFLAFGLAMLAFLYGAQPGHALTVEGLPAINLPESESPSREGPSREDSLEDLEEAEECEGFEGETEEDEVELEEECEEFDEGERAGSLPPSECLLRTASARVFTQTARDRVSLVLGYTSFAPANVTVDYRLKGGKGALNLGRTTHHFSKQGVFRVTGELNDSQMEKVKAAKDFEVRIRIPSAPGYCRSYFTRHLNSKRKVHGQVVWFQSESNSGKAQ
jgi:hypothetical protein